MKLVRSSAPDRMQLFDLRNDPAETIDLAEQAPEQRNHMLDELKLVLRAMSTEAVTTQAPVLTQEEIEHLASLGYIALPGEPDQTDEPSTD